MASIVGLASWGIVPLEFDDSNLATMSYNYRSNYLKSANDQLRYQIQWFYSGINEATEVGVQGGVVSVIFKIETSIDDINWFNIANIKKSRDITNKRYDNQSSPTGHRFTIDVSQLVADQLSYSLCPINKGTWQSNYYGGMNGGLLTQDNVIGGNLAVGTPISEYNVTENGAYRKLRVSATFEMIDIDADGNKSIITADNVMSYTPTITVINSVNQFERDSVYYNKDFLFNQYVSNQDNPRRFLTRCPNWHYNTDANKVEYNKLVRIDEQAEFLQFYARKTFDANFPNDKYNLIELYGETFTSDGLSENVFVLVDFTIHLDLVAGSTTAFAQSQNKMLIQNVSPAFINNNAYVPQNGGTGSVPISVYTTPISPITENTHRYRLYFRGHYFQDDGAGACNCWTSVRHSAVNWFEIDRESEKIPYGFVRFHWLNSMGGTDSYTAKRDIIEGINISRDVIERKSSDRTWYQDNAGAINQNKVNVNNDDYISNTMRGGNIYKGGREVLGLNAERVQSVYTEPLNISVAKWLEEITLSPNVWIEMETDATKRGNTVNPYQRPSTKEYIPVIITNSDIETVNQESGLVKFNLEYTLSHKVQTQRN
tara:strand:- start:1948 stop:3744 length:1797 start_codon:yes stop_codon:yes gene_type:complete